MADPGIPSAQPFRWHDLPTELQDWCLDYCRGTEELRIEAPEYEASMSIKDYPLWNLLAVSKQTKLQYEKRIAKCTTLILEDHENFNFSLLPLPPKVVGVERIHIRMFIVCEHTCPSDREQCQAPEDLGQTTSLINKILLQLPALEVLDVSLGLWWKGTEKLEWPNTPHDSRITEMIVKLAEMPQLNRLAVYRAPERFLQASKMIDDDKLVVSWNKDSKAWIVPKSREAAQVVVEEEEEPDSGYLAGPMSSEDETSAA